MEGKWKAAIVAGLFIQEIVVLALGVALYHRYVAQPAFRHEAQKMVAVDSIGYGLKVMDELGKGKIGQKEAQKRLDAFRSRIAEKYPGWMVLEAGEVVMGIPIDKELSGE